MHDFFFRRPWLQVKNKQYIISRDQFGVVPHTMQPLFRIRNWLQASRPVPLIRKVARTSLNSLAHPLQSLYVFQRMSTYYFLSQCDALQILLLGFFFFRERSWAGFVNR